MVRYRPSPAVHCIFMCRDTHVPLSTECAAKRVAAFHRTNIQWEQLQIERGGLMCEDLHMGFTKIVSNAVIVREAETQILTSQTAESSAASHLTRWPAAWGQERSHYGPRTTYRQTLNNTNTQYIHRKPFWLKPFWLNYFQVDISSFLVVT